MDNPTHMDNGATVDLTEGRVKTDDPIVGYIDRSFDSWRTWEVIRPVRMGESSEAMTQVTINPDPKGYAVIRSLVAAVESLRWRSYPTLTGMRSWCIQCGEEETCKPECLADRAIREAKAVLGE